MGYPEILNSFEKISLEEMDGVKLMNRTDTKFTFNEKNLDAILQAVKEKYKVLEINDKRASSYDTLYYDTSAYELYLKHQNGMLNRYKIRHRTYVDSQIGFLEVKFKNNKGRTIKTRIKKKDVPDIFQNESESFLKSQLPFDPSVLVPNVWVNYKRITLVSKSSTERLTIDTGLEFIKDGNVCKMNELVIAEVKQDRKQLSAFIELMKKLHIREGGISKYCLAVISTMPQIKKNSFKPKLINLKKIIPNVPFANFC
ncbi:MAG: polyphosphate polymerase domain-containing protein [Bacteroidota bacterium]